VRIHPGFDGRLAPDRTREPEQSAHGAFADNGQGLDSSGAWPLRSAAPGKSSVECSDAFMSAGHIV
jgi:hypothetical protein